MSHESTLTYLNESRQSIHVTECGFKKKQKKTLISALEANTTLTELEI